MPIEKATRQKTKEHNRDLILKTIFDHETVSRAEIARITSLTRTTVSNTVTFLIKFGLVQEVGLGESNGGKSPILLSLVADSRYMIGIDLAQDKFIGAIVNLRGKIKESVEIPVSDRNGKDALALVYKILDQLISKEYFPTIGIGIGTPGIVNTKEGIVVNAVNLDWQNLNLAKILNARYGFPVSVFNDSQAAAIGEYVYGGDHKADENLIVVNIKQGLGAGIFINGQLFQGDGGGAGEIGHVVVQKDGLLCRCGKRGCLETLASVRAVVQRAKTIASKDENLNFAKTIDDISLETLESAFFANHPLAQELIIEAGHYLGASIANLISILNIQKVVLTGNMIRFGEQWLQSVQNGMVQTAFDKIAQDTKIELGKIDFRSSILGASASMLMGGYSLLFQSELETRTNVQ